MRLGKFALFFYASLMPSAPARPALPDLRMPYQLDVGCYPAHVDDVTQIIRQNLALSLDDAQAMFVAPQLRDDLAHLTIRVLCSKTGHASLVRLVHRLGLEGAVRSVQWRSMTDKPLI